MSKIEEFIKSLQKDTYPEKPSPLHNQITPQAIEWVMHFVEGTQVLDVGCGQGVALAHFRDRGLNAIGITPNEDDLKACREQGFTVVNADMHFFNGDADTKFDLIWARHVLEHSPIPLYVLHVLKHCLARHGVLYAEMPAPGTWCRHERNANHYAVHTDFHWMCLFAKVGLEVVEAKDFWSQSPDRKERDRYFGFICQHMKSSNTSPSGGAEMVNAALKN